MYANLIFCSVSFQFVAKTRKISFRHCKRISFAPEMMPRFTVQKGFRLQNATPVTVIM